MATTTIARPVAYEVRSGTGATLARSVDVDMAEVDREMFAGQGYRAYVVWVELVPGRGWTAQED